MEESDEHSHFPKYLQEDDITLECKELIQTLPMEKGWVSTHLHQYQGFWQTKKHLQGVLSFQKHFQAHDTDIILATSPKAGTMFDKIASQLIRAIILSLLAVNSNFRKIGNETHFARSFCSVITLNRFFFFIYISFCIIYQF